MSNSAIDKETLQYLDGVAEVVATIRELEGYSEPDTKERLAIFKLSEAFMLCYTLLLERTSIDEEQQEESGGGE